MNTSEHTVTDRAHRRAGVPIAGLIAACGLAVAVCVFTPTRVLAVSPETGAVLADDADTSAPPKDKKHGKASKKDHADKDAESKDAATETIKGVSLIEIEGAIEEQPHPLAWLTGPGRNPTMRELVELFREAKKDKDTNAVVIRLKDVPLKLTQAEEIGSQIKALREAGKRVTVFTDGYETTEAVLGSYADEAIIQAGGGVSVPGMYMEEMYLADTLAWAGAKPQLVQVGDYKGANESMMRSSPSPQWEQNISGLLDGLYGNVREHLKSGRSMNDAQLDEAMKKSWMALAETGVKAGLIDAAVDLPDLDAHLQKKLGAKLEWTTLENPHGTKRMDMSNPFSMLKKLTEEPSNEAKRDSIAVLHLTGTIIDGESKRGGLMSESGVGSTTIRRALQEIEDQDLIKGVVVRIDSPGGSAIASEVMWQGINRLKAKKPVWVSVGSMAASGGYYVLSGADKVYVNPSSIVGSIGVVGGKVSLTGVYDHLKIKTVGRERGPMGRMLASSAPWTPSEEQLVREKMKETYDLFTSRVSAGRKGIDLSTTAEGRLFVGSDAVKNKMADKLGSMTDTIDDMAKELKLTQGDFDILDFPGPKSLGEIIGESVGGMVQATGGVGEAQAERLAPALVGGLMKEIVGPRNWPAVRDQMGALMLLRSEPVLLTSPTAIIVK